MRTACTTWPTYLPIGGWRPASAPVLGDITDAARLESVFAQFRPEVVFHAAAHKHVPMMEANPCEAVKNNVIGTRMVAEAAARHGVARFVLISTDKAVNPSSVMGATKRVAELIVTNHDHESPESSTAFLAVRFGNVLGSNGSVVPRFLEQIKSGGPITITHAEIRRYFMLLPEAVQLILHVAGQGRDGGTYVLDMGEQIKIADMARNLIRLSGFVPDEDIKLEFVGLRPGEKLFEELIGARETVQPSSIQKVFEVVSEELRPAGWFRGELRRLERFCEARGLDGSHADAPADRAGVHGTTLGHRARNDRKTARRRGRNAAAHGARRRPVDWRGALRRDRQRTPADASLVRRDHAAFVPPSVSARYIVIADCIRCPLSNRSVAWEPVARPCHGGLAAAAATSMCSARRGQSERRARTRRPMRRVQVGPLALAPVIRLTNFGHDSNVFNRTDDNPQGDFTATLSPSVEAWLRLPRARLNGHSQFDFYYFKELTDLRAVDTDTTARVELPLNRLTPYVEGTIANTRHRQNLEIDAIARRRNDGVTAGAELRLTGKVSAGAYARRSRLEYEPNSLYLGTDLGRELNHKSAGEGVSGPMGVDTLHDSHRGDGAASGIASSSPTDRRFRQSCRWHLLSSSSRWRS